MTPVWHAITGTVNVIDETEVHLHGETDATAYADGDLAPFDGGQRIRFTGTVNLSGPPISGIDAPILSAGIARDLNDFSFFTGLQVETDPAGAFPEAAYLYVYINGAFAAQLDLPYGNAINSFDFALDFNFPAGALAVTWTSSGVDPVTWSGSVSYVDSPYPFIGYTSGSAIEADFVGMAITVGG